MPHMVCTPTDFNRRCAPPPHNNEDGHSRHIANLRRGSHRAWCLWTATLAGLSHGQVSAARTTCRHDAGGKLLGCVAQKGHQPPPAQNTHSGALKRSVHRRHSAHCIRTAELSSQRGTCPRHAQDSTHIHIHIHPHIPDASRRCSRIIGGASHLWHMRPAMDCLQVGLRSVPRELHKPEPHMRKG